MMPALPNDPWLVAVSQILIYLGIAVLVLTALSLWWWFPKWQIRHYSIRDVSERGNLENSFRATIGQLIGGVGLIAGLIFTFAQFQESHNNFLKQEQQAQALREIQLRDQVNKQFSDGIVQLGSREIAVRIGGIINLERVIELSDIITPSGNPYRARIIQLLASFSRTPHGEPSSRGDDSLVVPLDNEIAMRVILRYLDPPRPNVAQRLILRGVVLTSTNFEEFRSARIDFTEAKFAKAVLSRADLSNSRMEGADLSGAVLNNSDLSGVRLHRAKLSGARLVEANLSGADLSEADLSGADLTSSDLTGANFADARVDGAVLTDTLGLSAAVLELACGSPRRPLPKDLAAAKLRPCPSDWPQRLGLR
jgi:hypothetical protein